MLIIRLEKQYRKTLDNKGLRMFTIAEAGPRLEGLKHFVKNQNVTILHDCRDMPTLRRIETITSSSNFLWLDAIADAVFQTDLLRRCHAFKMKERNSGINKIWKK